MSASKEKSIYATLNCFEGDITLRAACWYPAEEEAHIRQLLIRQSNEQQTNGMLVPDRVPWWPSIHTIDGWSEYLNFWPCCGTAAAATAATAAAAAAAAEICSSVAAGKNLDFSDIFFAEHVLSIFGRFLVFLNVLDCFWTF